MEEAEVSIAGYPIGNLSFDRIRNKLQAIIATSTVENIQSFTHLRLPDLLTLAPSAAGSPGISGGPVVNNAGSIVGIASSKSATKDDATLRAISTSYIDRIVQAQTSLSLRFMLMGDLETRSNTTKAAFSRSVIRALENNLLRNN